MYVYILLILLIVILAFSENQVNSGKTASFVFLVVFLLFAFRSYDVGVDTLGYILEYNYGESDLRGVDLGFTAYTTLLSELGVSSRLFLAISSLIMLFPYLLYINKSGTPRLFTILLYITIGTFTMQLSGLRQSMAVSFITLGVVLSAEIKRSFPRYLVLIGSVLLAETFHHTGIIGLLFVPMFIVMDKKWHVKESWLLLLAFLPVFLFFTSSIFAPLVDELMSSRYEKYQTGTQNINIIAFFLIPYFIFLYVLWLVRRVGLDDKYDRIGFLCAIVSILSASASMYMPILSRIEYYFSLPMLVLITHLTNKLNVSIRRLLFGAIGVVCILFFLVSTDGGILQIDNYQFSLE